MARIGLFGGTFDPVHTGHIALAEQVLREMNLDKIVFLPAGNPPHKTDKEVTDKRHRFRMVQLATQNHPAFAVSDYEILKETPNYSYQTVGAFRKLYPEDELFFVVGGDSFRDFPKWAEYEKLMELCSFIVVSRPGISPNAYFETFRGDEKPPRVFFVRDAAYDVSSTEIRVCLKEQRLPEGMLPPSVLAYIKEHRLYIGAQHDC